MSTSSIPLSRGPRDWFFVVVLSLFTATSLLSDAPHALGVTTGAFGDANRFDADVSGDRYSAINPMPLLPIARMRNPRPFGGEPG